MKKCFSAGTSALQSGIQDLSTVLNFGLGPTVQTHKVASLAGR